MSEKFRVVRIYNYMYLSSIHLRWNNKVCHIKRNVSNLTTTVLCVITIAAIVAPRSLQLGGDRTLHRACLLVAMLISKTISESIAAWK